jgi:hypothetical protein
MRRAMDVSHLCGHDGETSLPFDSVCRGAADAMTPAGLLTLIESGANSHKRSALHIGKRCIRTKVDEVGCSYGARGRGRAWLSVRGWRCGVSQ